MPARIRQSPTMPLVTFPLALATLIATYNVAYVWCGDQCFNIDQVQAGDNFPCEPSASSSNCCSPNDICLSNGLCQPTIPNSKYFTQLYTGYCTDPLFTNETICPKICNNNPNSMYGSGGGERAIITKWIIVSNIDGGNNGVVQCGNGKFCCYGDTSGTCCNTLSDVFSLGVATDVTTITGPSSTSITNTSRTSATPAVVNTPIVTFQASDPSNTKVSRTIGTNVATSTIIHTLTPAASSDSHVAVGVGAGVGVAVGLAILASFLYVLRRQSLRRGGPPRLQAVAKQEENRPRERWAIDELAAENRSVELFDPNGPRAELFEIRGARAEMGWYLPLIKSTTSSDWRIRRPSQVSFPIAFLLSHVFNLSIWRPFCIMRIIRNR